MVNGRISENEKAFIRHRGPDAEETVKRDSIEVYFARLAINGIDNGSQPFIDEQSRIICSVNGEIYNHELLRAELQKAGATFVTDSDAESVLHGFLMWGTEVFSRLDGMFAISICRWDSGEVYLARDRLGKKPLYFNNNNSRFYFSSEVRALLGRKFPFPPPLVQQYLQTDAICWDQDSLGAVTEVQPGNWVKFSGGIVLSQKFWSIRDSVANIRKKARSQIDWLDTYAELVFSATKKRLMSEAPIGAFLSSGMDSQLVTALAHSLGQIEVAFTLRFSETSYDESSGAREFAQSQKLPLVMVEASVDDLAEMWQFWAPRIDEPFADSAILPELLLASAARNHVKVILTGDGGDETLMGYQHVLAHRISESRSLRSIAWTGAELLQRLPLSKKDKYFSNRFKLNRFLRGAAETDLSRRDFAWRAGFSQHEAQQLIGRQNKIRDEFPLGSLGPSDTVPAESWEDAWSYLYLNSYLPHVILRKVDRATMRFGIEARSPLLASEVVEWAIAMPPKLRSTWFRKKIPLKHAYQKYVGSWKPSARKHGMGVPLVSLLTGPLRSNVTEAFDRDFLTAQGIFDASELTRLLEDFYLDAVIHARKVWSILVFQQWYRNVVADGDELGAR